MRTTYDIAFVGHYTKDTIISRRGTRYVHGGGAFTYGPNVAVRTGFEVAVISRLSKEDRDAVEALETAGIDVFITYTDASTCLTLEYPTDDPDKRVMSVASSAGAFTPEEVQQVEAQAFVLGPSLHGEIGLDVLEALRKKGPLIACDVQGYVRADVGGNVEYVDWDRKEMQAVLSMITILKTDAVEAERLTGEADKKKAAAMLSSYGPAEIVLTHRDGVLVYADKICYEAKFTPKEMLGRSGRGDTCVSAYVTKRFSAPPEEASIWAAAVTSLKMEAEGPFTGTFRDIEAKIRTDYRV
jgi:sugar/nucleoside kinase (ribokinase family)